MLVLNIIGSHTPLTKEEIGIVFKEAIEKYNSGAPPTESVAPPQLRRAKPSVASSFASFYAPNFAKASLGKKATNDKKATEGLPFSHSSPNWSLEHSAKEGKKKGHINLIFVKKDEIRNLNWDYRRKNKATDVLSFVYYDECLGEILICKDYIKENIRENLKTDMVKALIHGVLHIRGFDHERSEKEAKSMEGKEREIFQKILIKI